MTSRDGIAGADQTVFPPTGEVVELMLLLPSNQFTALEATAGQMHLTVGQLLRRTVNQFLLQPVPGNSCGGSG
jgi:hypothetical protein